MASLVLGAVGGYFFGPVGWLLGSAIGSMLFPQKQEGPRLSDLKLQSSSYGQMIPIPYGTVRLSGQVIWQTDLIEHKHKSGGKGGPQVTTYSYTASFAVKICKGPMGGLVRIWADSTLIYDTSATSVTDNSLVPLTLYLGVETALADPTMEADLGVGNVPAFRDDMVAVFTDMDLTNYGNRLPSLSFEVFGTAGNIPWRVATWSIPHGSQTAAVCVGIEGGVLLVGIYVSGFQNYTYTLDSYAIADGTHIANLITTGGPNLNGADGMTFFMAQNDPHISFARMEASGSSGDVSAWYVNGSLAGHPVSSSYYAVAQSTNVYVRVDKASLWAIGGSGGGSLLSEYPINSGAPDISSSQSIGIGATLGVWAVAQDSITNRVYLYNVGISATTELYVYDDTLTLLHHWPNGSLPVDMRNFSGSNFAVYDNLICFPVPTSPTTGNPAAMVYEVDPGTYALTLRGETPAPSGYFADLGNGLVAVNDGIISLNPPPSAAILSAIVENVSERAGLSSGQLDVSALTDAVDGYLITRQADARSAIVPLQSIYFFDGVERAGQMVFVKRGGASEIAIPDDDLAAQTPGATPPPLITYKRVQEVDLPATVNVSYLDVDVAYQEGSQQDVRETVESQAVSEIQAPIVMNAAKAKSAANVNLFGAWLERDVFTLLLPRKYQYLDPTDVISARGYTLRAIRKSDVASGITQLEGVQTSAALYVSAPGGNATEGGQQTTPTPLIPTDLFMLDIPLVEDSDAANGYYAAMVPRSAGAFTSAVLYKSADGGANYSSIGTDTDGDTVGTCSTVLGDFSSGNIFDESNLLTVVLAAGSVGTLAGSTQAAVLNGANAAMVGAEMIQFRDALLTAPLTYELSGLLRGRRGTDWAIGTHGASERFVLLPASLNPPGPGAEIGLARDFKAVTGGMPIAGALAVTFTNTDVAGTPYAPTQLGGYRNAGGDIFLIWTRRVRVGARDFSVNYPIGESTEFYQVTIFSDATYTAVKRLFSVAVQTVDYTAAEQTTDFGSPQAVLYWGVQQLGTYFYGYVAKGIT